jgi:hypothetical protein
LRKTIAAVTRNNLVIIAVVAEAGTNLRATDLHNKVDNGILINHNSQEVDHSVTVLLNHNVVKVHARVMHLKMLRADRNSKEDQLSKADQIDLLNKVDQTDHRKTDLNNSDHRSSDLLKTGRRNRREIILRRSRIHK